MIFGAKTFDFAMQFTPGWPCTHSVIISTANVDSNVRQITRIILQNFHLKSGLYAILCTLTEFKYNIISFEEFYS